MAAMAKNAYARNNNQPVDVLRHFDKNVVTKLLVNFSNT